MVITPPIGMDKALEASKPSIDNILNSLGIKSILDTFSRAMQSPEFQAAMPVMGMGLGGFGGGMSGKVLSEAVGRGGGATPINAPSSIVGAKLNAPGVEPTQQRSLADAISAAMPLMKDQVAIQRLSELLKMIGGQ